MKALLVCAGYAVRLFPLTENNPKPLLVVGGKPILEHIIDKVEKAHIVDEIIITTNNKYTLRFLDWKKQFVSKVPIRIINNGTLSPQDALGAVGDIHFALKNANIHDDVLIIAGDNLFEFDLRKFVTFKLGHSKVALFDAKDKSILANKFGVAQIDKEHKIIDFEEKPTNPKSTLGATMCYIIKKEDIPKYEHYVKEGNDVKNSGSFFTYLIQKVPVYGFRFTEPWFDIGTLESLEEADKKYSEIKFL